MNNWNLGHNIMCKEKNIGCEDVENEDEYEECLTKQDNQCNINDQNSQFLSLNDDKVQSTPEYDKYQRL